MDNKTLIIAHMAFEAIILCLMVAYIYKNNATLVEHVKKLEEQNASLSQRVFKLEQIVLSLINQNQSPNVCTIPPARIKPEITEIVEESHVNKTLTPAASPTTTPLVTPSPSQPLITAAMLLKQATPASTPIPTPNAVKSVSTVNKTPQKNQMEHDEEQFFSESELTQALTTELSELN